jgi:hypothetical protein
MTPQFAPEIEEIIEEAMVDDKFANSTAPFSERFPKVELVRAFITQFDGS